MPQPRPEATCPPHHWLIAAARGGEHWTCHRCGLIRQPERRVVTTRRLSNRSTWARDEIALLESAGGAETSAVL
ncbi:MAG TPA: hypothetical protein VKZ60_01100 [Chloroflexota bacterium]|jgi:Zn-finger protein|nr:hypothetical protein [Chloroflexota bacterium]